MSPLEGVATALQTTWPVLHPAEVATALTLASLTEIFTAPPALTLNQFAYAPPGGTS